MRQLTVLHPHGVRSTGRALLGTAGAKLDQVATPVPVDAGAPKSLSGVDGANSARPFVLSESKLHAPVVRPGIVTRTALLDRLIAVRTPALISVVAPAGYGKTTLLAQWVESKQPRVAWVSADHRDNDPAVLLTHLAAAIDGVQRINRSLFRALAAPGAGKTIVPLLTSALASMTEPIAIVLDNAESVTNRVCLDIITELALSVPPFSQFAIASRDSLPLPSARLRAQAAILEIGTDELAMDYGEASSLLDGAGVQLSADDIEDLVERTEGWPAGMYLAALAINAGSPRAEAVFSFTGDDYYIGDYLRSELLDRVSRTEVLFLTRTSILDRMSGPLCDATLATEGSSSVLEELHSRNLLVVPLDRRRHWYRYHQLFRQLLYAELTRREPDMIPVLHHRAVAWYEANGRPEAAIEHAQAAGDANLVAGLVLKWMQPVWASGRVNTVLRWMEWLEDKSWVEHYSEIAIHASLILALLGQPGAAERWAGAAERTASPGTLPDGEADGLLAYLRALLCRHGVAQMRKDAQTALEELSHDSPYRATMLHTEGVSYLLEDDPATADPILAHALDVAAASGAVPFVPLILAERGIAAIQQSDWTAAESLAEQALEMVHDGHFDEYWTSALVFAWGARVVAHSGDVAQARQYAARAAHLRPLLTYALPVVSAQALLELGHVYLAIGDASGLRAVLRQTQDIFQQRPDLGVLPRQAGELRAKLATLAAGTGGASSLTTAELRLAPLLSSHLTLKEISERLYLSRNTVKTQVTSIYRKFGVASRSEAITRMREVGLFSPD